MNINEHKVDNQSSSALLLRVNLLILVTTLTTGSGLAPDPATPIFWDIRIDTALFLVTIRVQKLTFEFKIIIAVECSEVAFYMSFTRNHGEQAVYYYGNQRTKDNR